MRVTSAGKVTTVITSIDGYLDINNGYDGISEGLGQVIHGSGDGIKQGDVIGA